MALAQEEVVALGVLQVVGPHVQEVGVEVHQQVGAAQRSASKAAAIGSISRAAVVNNVEDRAAGEMLRCALHDSYSHIGQPKAVGVFPEEGRSVLALQRTLGLAPRRFEGDEGHYLYIIAIGDLVNNGGVDERAVTRYFHHGLGLAKVQRGLVVAVEQVEGRAPKHLDAVLLAQRCQRVVARFIGRNHGYAAGAAGLLHSLDLPHQQRLAHEVEAYFVGQSGRTAARLN
nr:hypothetical protein [Tanacetum cinerariifolium]